MDSPKAVQTIKVRSLLPSVRNDGVDDAIEVTKNSVVLFCRGQIDHNL